MAKPSLEPWQADYRADVLTGEAPQQTCYSSTVPCDTYSHLWQMESLEIALTLPMSGCSLQVLVKFPILSQSWVMIYGWEASSPTHATFCNISL